MGTRHVTEHVTSHVKVRQLRGARHRTCDGMSEDGGWPARGSLGPFGKNCVWDCVDATRVRGRSWSCPRNTSRCVSSSVPHTGGIRNCSSKLLVHFSTSHYDFAAGIRCGGIATSVARVVGWIAKRRWTNFRQTVAGTDR